MAEDPRIVFFSCSSDFDTFFVMTCPLMVFLFVDQTAGPLGTVGLGSCIKKISSFCASMHLLHTYICVNGHSQTTLTIEGRESYQMSTLRIYYMYVTRGHL